MINYVNKNIIEVPYGIIAHGCNAMGVMGSGVAKVIKTKWPSTYMVYKNYCNSTGNRCLGHVIFDGPIVGEFAEIYLAHCITQSDYGKDGKVYANPGAIQESMKRVFEFAVAEEIDSISIPPIGCGLGGLNWGRDVEPVINGLSVEYNIDVWVYDINEN